MDIRVKIRLYLCEEVVALVVNENEGREVLYLYLPYGLHAKLWILDTLNRLDARAGEDSRYATNRAEVKAAVLLAGICDSL